MLETAHFLHFLSIGLTVGLTSMGVGIGGGIASTAAIDAINIQPKASHEISKISLLGMALVETAGVLGVVISIMLFSQTPKEILSHHAVGVAELGIFCALGIAGCVVGMVSSLPVAQACLTTARQPFFASRILNLTLLTLSLIQTPLIFAFLIALLIKSQITLDLSFGKSLNFLAAGLCVGIGSIGPTIGLARFARAACKGLGIQRNSYDKLLPFTFVSMAIVETPIVFSLIIALLLSQQNATSSVAGLVALFAAALCMGLGTIGPGMGSSSTAIAAAQQISYNYQYASVLAKVSMVAQALIDAAAIYALLVAMLIIFLH